MRSFWIINARKLLRKQPSTWQGDEFNDLVRCKKHQQGPQGILCGVVDGEIVALAKEREVVAAQEAGVDVICHFTNEPDPSAMSILVNAGARRLSDAEVEFSISGGSFLRQIIGFCRVPSSEERQTIVDLVYAQFGSCVSAVKWDQNLFVIDILGSCEIEGWARIFRQMMQDIHESVLAIRTFQGKSFQ